MERVPRDSEPQSRVRDRCEDGSSSMAYDSDLQLSSQNTLSSYTIIKPHRETWLKMSQGIKHGSEAVCTVA